MMDGQVIGIRAYPAKGEAGIKLKEGKFLENLGLEGDFHAKGGDRQVSLLCAETRDLMIKQKERGLCFSRFKENITIRFLDDNIPRFGARLEAGEGVSTENSAVLEITGETKSCHKECSLYQAGKRCPLSGMSLFAKVIKGGIIRVGDSVTVKSVLSIIIYLQLLLKMIYNRGCL
jgi:MOSC domain-containing protein YiiM